jgi:hypothetical protein
MKILCIPQTPKGSFAFGFAFDFVSIGYQLLPLSRQPAAMLQ